MAGNASTGEAGAGGPSLRRIIWISFLLAVVAYGIVGYHVVGRGPAAPRVAPDWVWGVFAAAMAGAAFWVPKNVPLPPAETPSGLRTPEVVGWVLAEAVATVGLVSVALGGGRAYLIGYLVVAAAILWLQRPGD